MLKGKYRKTAQLGQGRFGTVYEAMTADNQIFAIKKYAKLSGRDIPCEILREINVMKMLNHPNLIRIYDVHMENTEIDVVMEHGGESLGSYIIGLSFAERVARVKHIAYQIIISCLYMHKLEIIHRDLKPDNILVSWGDDKPVVKICDFGLAKKLLPFLREFNTHQLCTLSYRPPELFTSEIESYSEAVDVWSIGCVLYEFIIGRKLFQGSKDCKVLQSILQQVPTTERDLEVLHLDNIRLDKCNIDNYYKFPALYDLSMRDGDTKRVLDDFHVLVRRMLTLNPSERANLGEIIDDPFFDGVRTYYKDLGSALQNYRIRYYQNFRIRRTLKISSALRKVHIEHIIALKNSYKMSDQTIFVAINIFDRYLESANPKNKSESEQIRSSLTAVANCCVVLASKYIDVKPLRLKDFVFEGFSYKKIAAIERSILERIDFDLTQPTLINFYKQLMDDGVIGKRDNIPEIHLVVARDILSNYDLLIDKGIPELKEIFLSRILKIHII